MNCRLKFEIKPLISEIITVSPWLVTYFPVLRTMVSVPQRWFKCTSMLPTGSTGGQQSGPVFLLQDENAKAIPKMIKI
jgi:hypothetical protein